MADIVHKYPNSIPFQHKTVQYFPAPPKGTYGAMTCSGQWIMNRDDVCRSWAVAF